MSSNPKIFISYRRGDTSGYSSWLAATLKARFPEDVFIDLGNIEGGEDFERTLRNAAEGCHVLLVVISPQWSTRFRQKRAGMFKSGQKDWVKLEIETALKSGSHILPVLVHGAQMPDATRLPESLRNLCARHGIELRDDNWEGDVYKVIARIEELFSQPKNPNAGQPRVEEPPRPAAPPAARIELPPVGRSIADSIRSIVGGIVFLAVVIVAIAMLTDTRRARRIFDTAWGKLFTSSRAPESVSDHPTAEDIAHYREIVWERPDDAQAHFDLAMAYHNQDRYEDAITQYKEGLKLKSDVWSTHYNLGLIYKHQKLNDEAVAEFKEAIRIKPDAYKPHASLGYIYGEQKQYEKAIAEYKESLRLKPDNSEVHNNLGNAYSNNRQEEEAIAEYKEAIRLEPNAAEAHYNLALSYEGVPCFEDAVKEYKEATRLAPDDFDIHRNLATLYFNQQRYEDAIVEFKETVRLKPDDGDPHYQLAESYRQLKNYQEAVPQYLMAIKLKPDDVNSHYNLGLTYVALKDNDKKDNESKRLAMIEYQELIRLRAVDNAKSLLKQVKH